MYLSNLLQENVGQYDEKVKLYKIWLHATEYATI